MSALNCFACHARDGVGGVAPGRNAYFTSSGEDRGDEGRLPPLLDGVGDKLRVPWMTEVLLHGGSVRPCLNARMPQFGEANVRDLPDLFAAIDRHARPVPPSPDPAPVRKEVGRRLVGTDGLSCVVCHRFNRQPAQAMQVIDLITAPERLNEDWFRSFLLDPNRYHPGTRMPAFWPDGKSPLPTVLAGDAQRQFAAIWAYLADGPKARFPEGVSRANLELVVGGEAIVYRGKLWEAGFRAVAVGYPECVNIAFDAEANRLSLLWQGRFLNVAPHWSIQGMGKIRPLGTGVVILPHGPGMAVLPTADAPWPAEVSQPPEKVLPPPEMRFKGYELDALKRPTLLYTFRGLSVEDAITGAEREGQSSVGRTIRFNGDAPDRLFLRLGAGKIEPAGERAWRLDDAITLRLGEAADAHVRRQGEQSELIVPIVTHAGHGSVEVEYAW